MVEFNEEKQNQKIEDLHKAEEENLTLILSSKYNLPYLDLASGTVNRDALRVLPEDKAREAKIAIFNIVDKKIHIGVQSPNNQKSQDAIKELEEKGFVPVLYMVSSQGLERVWEKYKDLSYSFETRGGALDISNEEITNVVQTVKHLEDVRKLIEDVLAAKKGYRISRTLEIILAGSLATKASDVHIEPEEKYVRIRYRLDGVLVDVINFDHETFALLLSRIKLISGLKLNIKGIAQDGRFTIKMEDSDIEIRTSVLPGAYSDSVVMRILNPKAISVPLEELGIHPRLLKILEHEIAKPNGMLLTTGPTGSGKTTTLYAFLKKVHTPEIKIITIENPIEYHLPGIVQTQTDSKKGYTFLEGLRSALRQDPDVIMVGEIRDQETAEIAINASLTGHLVFSTLHTNNAAGSFPRLIDLGVNPKILTSAINVSMAQRLLRTLCNDCKKIVPLQGEEKELIDSIVETITDKTYLKDVQRESVWEHQGCEKCNFTGYKGRIGIFEAIKTDEAIERVVKENPSEREVEKAALAQNILNMKQDGAIKVLEGKTSLLELQRVVDLQI
ncbi:MAG: GspE/PulE family protein [Patescibacteria group bacterium]|nr:GspE/PulE family protein [bacterium]MDZ4240974.1 GspE/PulE family protein [Patescibacteria group bacterium]